MKKGFFFGLLFSLIFLVFTGASHAQIIIDISESNVDIMDYDKIKIRQIVIDGLTGKYWADLQWDPYQVKFVPINYGPEIYEVKTFTEGLANPSGLDIHPINHSLYVKSGTTGRVWSIPINPDGTAGTISVVTEAFVPDMDIVFDAAGNLYGLESNSDYMYRLGTAGDVSKMEFRSIHGLHTGITIETPCLPSNSLFFSYCDRDPYNEIGSIDINQFSPGGYIYYDDGPDTCGDFRFLFYRQSVGGIAGTYGDSLVNINPSDGSCTTMLSGFVQPNGIAEDDTGNIYVADSGAGTITKITRFGQSEVIASSLKSPIGLVYDSQTRLLFVSENEIGRISVITIP